MKKLYGRSLLHWFDYTPEEINILLSLSHKVKREYHQGKRPQRFRGQSIALLFEKRSTRTRCAFETAFGEEGGHPVFLSTADIQLGGKETIEDTARVLGRMFDAIEFRGFAQSTVETLAKYSGVPVFNGLTDTFHPTQALADIMTIQENFDSLEGKIVAYIGDGRNNVATSLMIICAKLGIECRIISPESLQPAKELLDQIQACCNTKTVVSSDISASQGADVFYTDVWVSMGEEEKSKERLELLRPYQINQEMMSRYGKAESIFLHCLPAVVGQEVSKDVYEGPQSKIWDQAENRKHSIKAIMLAAMRGKA